MAPRHKKPDMLYFAYGANMNTERNCRKAKILTVARLPDHKLSFYEHSDIWDGGAETLISAAGEDLWGIVYQLAATDSDVLDIRQDAKQDGTGAYFHTPEDVIGEDGKIYSVLVYKKAMLGNAEQPSEEQMADIIASAEKHALPMVYIEGLKKITTKKARYPVPMKGSVEEFLKNFVPCDC
ncbi:MAG: gamma-glutamylcyclotransferase family protein [Zymomonas mobilis subsp. pomaceae]|uniref:Fe-only nitrogenase accessory protein AnfR n=1 Tax=Zymomonas mobilis subsp. pomaceae (strain ATCC 29192 / DSM 22645 / JCM 10191 / CCUG 17912 / NBRC 13757 / NCIMB 11200 / NRRL B-4491 / Barker I) TaxID=579138 RepID=F8EST4_ZYMMT|nr:gamma-glutamylcyclotransferase family protein [Zymomonas mobilis]AEI37859.1 Fe-only nitrogenase accessory protein AnfR [Zymomonas mobilis subsp. pomaceae ATCC 29192]MDX5949226.1 gamma-glutamylcyclotransferase family protein [Zymomonas mobilis subsp. pomaceae]GEB89545.1 gamma-glutamylcyclotransferase [Zymomonas mobilis subsp. pomaceae]